MDTFDLLNPPRLQPNSGLDSGTESTKIWDSKHFKFTQ
jgi:hypothetical protein